MWIIRAILTIIGTFFKALFKQRELDDKTKDQMLDNIKKKGGLK